MALGTATRKVRQRKDQIGGFRHAAREHVMPPDQGTHDGNGHRGVGNRLVSEDRLVGKGRDDFGDGAHGRQDHDVDRRVRVDPEQVLVEERIASFGRIEYADPEQALGDHQQQRDPDDRSREHLDPGRPIKRPDKERHAMPGHAGSAQPVNRRDEVQAGQDRGDHQGQTRPETPSVTFVPLFRLKGT